MVPKDVHELIPETCEYVTLHSKREFAIIIKVKSIEKGYLVFFR